MDEPADTQINLKDFMKPGTIYSAKTVAVRAGVFPRRNVFGMLREVAEQVPYHEVKCGISDRTLWRLK